MAAATAAATGAKGAATAKDPAPQVHTVDVRSAAGRKSGTVDLDPEFFGIEPNVAVMHQVVTAQLAARRRGTQSTKTRAEVRGGAGKPWRQKGTGRARHGSTRNPQWRGGGVALGPKPRSYRQRTPKKMVRLALCSALSDRASGGNVIVVNDWQFEDPRTKEAVAALKALKAEGRVLLVAHREQPEVWKSFRNLPEVQLISPAELNAYDVLVSDVVVFTLDTLPSSSGPSSSGPSSSGPGTAKDDAKTDDAKTDGAKADKAGDES